MLGTVVPRLLGQAFCYHQHDPGKLLGVNRIAVHNHDAQVPTLAGRDTLESAVEFIADDEPSRSLHPHPRKRLLLEHERKRASRAAALT